MALKNQGLSNNQNNNNPSGATGFSMFALITSIYFILRYYITDQNQLLILSFAYGITILIMMYFINLDITKNMCGSPQVGTSLMVTAIPWAVVFGGLIGLLMVFPGWLSPFSNTFGYLAAKLSGVGTLLDKILKPKFVNAKTAVNERIAAEALQQIYDDKSLLINQITLENFDTFWNRMTSANLFNKGANEFKQQLYNMVRLKNIISYYVWYMLSGALITSMSYNYIVGIGCKKSAKEMQLLHSKYENEQKALKDSENSQGSKRIYNITD
jgi:predicted membrane protein